MQINIIRGNFDAKRAIVCLLLITLINGLVAGFYWLNFFHHHRGTSLVGGNNLLLRIATDYSNISVPVKSDAELLLDYDEVPAVDTVFEALFGTNKPDQVAPAVVHNGTDPKPAEFYAKRSRKAQQLADAIQERYFKHMSKLMSGDKQFDWNFLAYRCVPTDGGCGGFADRTRGLVSLFYIALGLQYVFHVEWTRTSLLSDYFKINADFYDGVDQEYYNSQLEKAKAAFQPATTDFMNLEREAKFAHWARRIMPSVIGPRYESFRTNSLAGLEGALQNPALKQNFNDLFASIDGIDKDIAILVSAFLRNMFAKPDARLLEIFERCVIQQAGGNDLWLRSYKIGVQVRQGSFGHVMITERQLTCFVDFVEKIIKQRPTNEPIIVFVTADANKRMREIKRKFQDRLKGVTVVTSSDDKKCASQLKYVHIDSFADPIPLWYEAAKAYVDWLAMTKMDRLVISRSGYSEMASLFSLVPTQRFAHWSSVGSNGCVFHDYNQMGSFFRFEIYPDGQ